jgi:hypothetical protein
MPTPTEDLFRTLIKEAYDAIDRLERSISSDPPPTPAQLQSIHDLQHRYRSNIDEFNNALKEVS